MVRACPLLFSRSRESTWVAVPTLPSPSWGGRQPSDVSLSHQSSIFLSLLSLWLPPSFPLSLKINGGKNILGGELATKKKMKEKPPSNKEQYKSRKLYSINQLINLHLQENQSMKQPHELFYIDSVPSSLFLYFLKFFIFQLQLTSNVILVSGVHISFFIYCCLTL